MGYNTRLFARRQPWKVSAPDMTTRNHSADRDRSNYHHGDLRRELLRVARTEIAARGAQAVSLSTLARLAGVSQPAPYRHFPDRTALLEAVAADAFADFTTILAKAVLNQGTGGALVAIARAYVAFGESNVELYRLMFASRLTPQAASGSDLDTAADKAFSLLKHAMLETMPIHKTEAVYQFWAQLHGLVMLKADGFITSPLSSFIGLESALVARAIGPSPA